jgi:hypothetical protein
MRAMPASGAACRIQSVRDAPHDRSRRDLPRGFTSVLMLFDTKIAIVVRDDLASWQKLNVACFLSGGLVGSCPELAGERYVDASGQVYGRLIRQPVVVFSASAEELQKVLRRALERGLTPSLYTKELFATGHDAANRAAVASVSTEALDLVGLGLHGERKEVDKVTKGLALHS